MKKTLISVMLASLAALSFAQPVPITEAQAKVICSLSPSIIPHIEVWIDLKNKGWGPLDMYTLEYRSSAYMSSDGRFVDAAFKVISSDSRTVAQAIQLLEGGCLKDIMYRYGK